MDFVLKSSAKTINKGMWEAVMAQLKKRVVVCLSCRKEVEVALVPYGYGHIGACSDPGCGKLAYNGK